MSVKVLGDEVDEGDEAFIMRFNSTRTTDSRVVFFSGASKLEVIGTITDDDEGEPGKN